MPNINKIKLSGTSYDIQDLNAPSVSSVTQAQYDVLPESAKTSNTLFIITDAQAGDLTQYWTSAQTQSAITQATSGLQPTLSAGTGIDITDNVISATGGTGGGKAISAGTNISVTTGETADTINCTLPITAKYAIAIGHNADANGENSLVIGDNTGVNGTKCIVVGSGDARSYYKGGSNFISVGGYNSPNYTSYSALFGSHVTVKNNFEVGIGTYNISNTGSTEADKTRFSIGNGDHFGATNVDHNIIDVRSNGDIYIADTNASGEYYEKPMIKLQDHLGASYSAGTGIDITNNVISVSGVVETSAITTTITSSSTDAQIPSAKAVYDIVGNIETLLSQI